MPWRPLPGIAFAIATHPFKVTSGVDLPLELGDELYIIEEGGKDWSWLRGYLVSPPSLLAGLTSIKGQPLEARVYSGIFPRSCVEIREILGKGENAKRLEKDNSLIKGGKPSTTQPSDRTHPLSQRSPSQAPSAGTTTANGFSVFSQPQTLTTRRPGSHKPSAPVPMLRIGEEAPTLASEPLVDEIASCLREWHSTNLHELLLSRNYKTLGKLSNLVTLLDTSRRQLLHGVLTNSELSILREKVVWDLVSGNKMLGNEVVVRDPKEKGRLLVGTDNVVEIAKLQTTMSLFDRPISSPPDKINLHHLMIDLKDFVGDGSEILTVVVHIAIKEGEKPLVPLTESFAMDLPAREHLTRFISYGRLRTLFPNLTASDVGAVPGGMTKLYLVARVISSQNYSQSGPPIRSPTTKDASGTNSDITSPTSINSGKAGRRSLMWGSSKPRQGGSSTSRLEGLQEDTKNPPSPPEATSSSRPQTRGRDTTRIKRAIAAAVLPLSDLMTLGKDVERDVAVFASSGENSRMEKSLEDWSDDIAGILASSTGTYRRLRSLSSLKFRLVSFISSDADELIRTTPTLLHDIQPTNKMGFSGAPLKRRSDIYLTIKESRLPDGAVFSHPEKGFLPLGRNLEMSNLQLTLEVRKNNGDRIENCIFPTSDAKGVTAWRSIAASRQEKWEQTIRLSIPDEDVASAHMIMSIADAPNFPFALCWMPLWVNGAFLQDGSHSPLLHMYDKVTSRVDENGRGAYLGLPWDSKGKESLKFESVAGPMATLGIDTRLCSTVFSQDKVLLGILRWKELDTTDLMALLRQLNFVPEIEIVNHANNLFDALFAILVDHSGRDDFEDLIFTNLVTVLGIVYDRRFNLGPLVKVYAESKFRYPFATPCLIRSFLRLTSRPNDGNHSRQLRATIKVGQQIMKFIVIARKQQMAKEASIGVTNTAPAFNRDLKEIFSALESQMRDQNPHSIGNRTLLVQHIHTWLPELYTCFSQDEVMEMTIRFINACENVEGKLVLHKLTLIYRILKDQYGVNLDQEAKKRFKSRLYGWLDPYWGEASDIDEQYFSQIRLCCTILSLLDGDYGDDTFDFYIKILGSYQSIKKHRILPDHEVSLLFQESFPFQTKPVDRPKGFNETLTELATLKATVSPLEVLSRVDTSGPSLLDTIFLALDVDMSIISGDAFPTSWLTLNVTQHRAIFDMLNGMSRVLLKSFLPDPEEADDFNTDLWRQFLLAVLTLVRSDTLALENFPDQKRRAVWKIGGDIREKGATLLASVWDALGWETDSEEREYHGLSRIGGFQVQYVPSLVAPIVDLCLSVHGGLRNVAVEILRSMVLSEWSLNEDLGVVHAEMISCLDNLFKYKQIDDTALPRTFISELKAAFSHMEAHANPELWQAIQNIIVSLDKLLELLVAAHTTEQEESSRIKHMLELMDYLKGMSRESLFIDYVHYLAKVEVEANNPTEAGLALRLHADLYSWEPMDMLPELTSPKYPRQSSFERKEALYFEMITYFEEASAWEPALAAYQDLAAQYAETTFDFLKLARTQRSMARIYEMIARGETNTPRYYRVIYSGMGFPAHLRDRAFIFEGSGSERLVQFTDRLQQQYPSAKLIAHNEMDLVEGQFLQVTPVNPHRDLNNPLYQRQKVSHSTKEFLSSIETCRFSLTTKRHSPKTEVKDQWVEKTIYTTADVFPTILRRSEIMSEKTVSLAPLETALERTLRKLYELAILDRRVGNGDESSIFALTDAIRSSVDPSSNSSVAKYRELLPTVAGVLNSDIEVESAPEPLEIALQTALIDFASTIKHALLLLQKESQSHEYSMLSMQFASTFAPEILVLGASAQYPPGQVPHKPTSLTSTNVRAKQDAHSSNVNRSDTKVPSSNAATAADLNRHTRRISTLLKRPGAVVPVHDPPFIANGHFKESQRSPLVIENSDSRLSSRPKMHERQENNNHSALDPEDGPTVPDLKRPNIPPNPDNYRPDTAHSAVTSKSGRSGKKSGSIRKRLSTFSIGGAGKKTTLRGPKLGERGRVEEE